MLLGFRFAVPYHCRDEEVDAKQRRSSTRQEEQTLHYRTRFSQIAALFDLEVRVCGRQCTAIFKEVDLKPIAAAPLVVEASDLFGHNPV